MGPTPQAPSPVPNWPEVLTLNHQSLSSENWKAGSGSRRERLDRGDRASTALASPQTQDTSRPGHRVRGSRLPRGPQGRELGLARTDQIRTGTRARLALLYARWQRPAAQRKRTEGAPGGRVGRGHGPERSRGLKGALGLSVFLHDEQAQALKTPRKIMPGNRGKTRGRREIRAPGTPESAVALSLFQGQKGTGHQARVRVDGSGRWGSAAGTGRLFVIDVFGHTQEGSWRCLGSAQGGRLHSQCPAPALVHGSCFKLDFSLRHQGSSRAVPLRLRLGAPDLELWWGRDRKQDPGRV